MNHSKGMGENHPPSDWINFEWEMHTKASSKYQGPRGDTSGCNLWLWVLHTQNHLYPRLSLMPRASWCWATGPASTFFAAPSPRRPLGSYLPGSSTQEAAGSALDNPSLSSPPTLSNCHISTSTVINPKHDYLARFDKPEVSTELPDELLDDQPQYAAVI